VSGKNNDVSAGFSRPANVRLTFDKLRSPRACVEGVKADATFVSVVAALVLVLVTASGVRGQAAQTRTVWDGVYTEAQASRGKVQYEASCRSCHRDGPRRDDEFMRDWGGSDLESLFKQIKVSMPAGAPSSLSDAAYADIVAYVLQANAFPAGRSEFAAAATGPIRIEGRNGPAPVPDFALVRVVGCLSQGPGTAWTLADAGEPIRTKDPAASTDDELKQSQEAGPGTQVFWLLNVFPAPDPYAGHRVEAKGFLIRDPGGNRINVTSVRTLAPRCDGAR
jgi:mono/diheme cytochrome c family protein